MGRNELREILDGQQVTIDTVLQESEESKDRDRSIIKCIGVLTLTLTAGIVIGCVAGGWYLYRSGPQIMGFVPNSIGTKSYLELEVELKELKVLAEKAIKTKERTEIWFDRKRTHHDTKFAGVDRKFPAQYEVWEGDKFIARWHWHVDGEPLSDLWGEGIHRCVVDFRDGKYNGFTTTIMSGFPNEVNNPKPNSIVNKIVHDTATFAIWTLNDDCTPHGLRVTWEMGELASVEHLVDGVPKAKRGDCGDSTLAEMWEAENSGRYNRKRLEVMTKYFPFLSQLLDNEKSD